MQKKYGKDGVIVLSVQLDSLDERKSLPAKVAKILKDRGADFTTVILDEDQDFWQDRLRFTTYPSVFVFNREGKWTQFKSEDKKYKELDPMLRDVDQLVATLVARK